MDPNPLRHLEYFSVPNHQTHNPVDQSFIGGTSSAPSTSLWDAAADLEAGPSGPTSTAPTSMSLESYSHASADSGFSTMSPHPSIQGQQMYSNSNSQVLTTRGPRTREGHERKRSRLNPDISPFDEPDYWLQFDNDEQLADIPEGVEAPPNRPDPKGKTRAQSIPHSRPPLSGRPGLPRRASNPAGLKSEDFLDDSALDNALSDEEGGLASINLAEHLSKIDNPPPPDVPPREGLYSTPLSWERPQPGLRTDSLIGLSNNALNEAEQRRLIAIAMNPGPSMGGLGSNVNLNFGGGGFGGGMNPAFLGQGGGGFGGFMGAQHQQHNPYASPNSVSPPYSNPVASGSQHHQSNRPEAPPAHSQSSSQHARPPPPSRKHSMMSDKGKGPATAAGGSGGGGGGEDGAADDRPKPGDRTAHNDIERKYRTNLKDKIAELRDAVPALHSMNETGAAEDDPSHPRGAPKVSKGTILTKATEYIHQLERRNKEIAMEHRELSRKLQAFEQLLHHTATTAYQMPAYSRTLFDPRGFC